MKKFDSSRGLVRFEGFQLDLGSGELLSDAGKVFRLSEQPFRILIMLLRRPGEVLTREEIRNQLWPNDTIVEFEHSISAAMNRLRQALGDSADRPHYIETLARRGYRWMVSVDYVDSASSAASGAASEKGAAGNLIGRKVSHFRVLAILGGGGMGVVYKAEDLKLGRLVALKFLPEELASDPVTLERFEREARAASALNHPNICTIYGTDEHEGHPFIVMELLEGKSLTELISGSGGNQRPLPRLEEFLDIAIQVSEGLEAAHAMGIVHRDIKPGNIFVTGRSQAKILDFGLAKKTPRKMIVEGPTNPPTISRTDEQLTSPGAAIGTIAYMSPEQARGEDLDSRSDLFSFGAVLYQMATGRPPFTGETSEVIFHAILRQMPPAPVRFNPRIPTEVERIIGKALEKDREERYQSARDLLVDIRRLKRELSSGSPDERWQHGQGRTNREWMAWGVTGLALLATVLLGVGSYKRTPATPAVTRFVINPPEQHSFDTPDGWLCCNAVSPDGRQLALLTFDSERKSSLWLRPLDSVSAVELPGTEGVEWGGVWSGDSRFLLFTANGKLKKVDVMGGLPDPLCDAKGMLPGSWSSSNTVLFSGSSFAGAQNRPIRQLTLEDCSIKPVTKPDLARYDHGHMWPNFLPDGRHFVYAALRKDKKHDVLLGTMGSETSEILVRNASYPKYVPPGYLFFERNGYLFAQRFNPRKLRLAGDPVQVIPQQLSYVGLGGIANYDVSGNGVLTYQEQGEVRSRLVLRDATGKQLQAFGESAKPGESFQWSNLRLAPNRKRLLISRNDTRIHTGDLWIYDLQRQNWERFSLESTISNDIGVLSPDGRTIVYAAVVGDLFKMYRRPADRSRAAEPLLENDMVQEPTDWSPDGRFLLYTQSETGDIGDLWVLPMKGDLKSFPLTDTGFDERDGRFSPDGRWIAYSSDVSGKREIYVRSFPGLSREWQISSGGGKSPRWSDDGTKIYYLTLDWKLTEIPLKTGAEVHVGTPRSLFSLSRDSEYEVYSRDKFLVNEQQGNLFGRQTVVLNWDAALGLTK